MMSTPEQGLVRRALRVPLQRGMGFLPILGRDGRDVAWSNGVELHPGRGWRLGWAGLDDLISEATQSGKSRAQHFCKSSGIATPNWLWRDFWPVQGNPEPGTYTGSALTARQLDDTVAGGFPHGGNVSTDTKHLLWCGLQGSGVGNHIMGMLYDRVLTYEACPSSNSLQSMTNTLTAQRYTTSLGIMATVQAALTSTATFSALTYTNQGGSSKTVPGVANYNITATGITTGPTIAAHMFTPSVGGQPFYPLAAGDSGVENIVSYQMAGNDATGTICFILGYPIAYFGFDQPDVKDLLRACVAMERIFDGAHLSLAVNTVGQTQINEQTGMFGVAWG